MGVVGEESQATASEAYWNVCPITTRKNDDFQKMYDNHG
jgi:hypothetical protein